MVQCTFNASADAHTMHLHCRNSLPVAGHWRGVGSFYGGGCPCSTCRGTETGKGARLRTNCTVRGVRWGGSGTAYGYLVTPTHAWRFWGGALTWCVGIGSWNGMWRLKTRMQRCWREYVLINLCLHRRISRYFSRHRVSWRVNQSKKSRRNWTELSSPFSQEMLMGVQRHC